MVVDEDFCCIDSVNMDMRSLKVDEEIYENALFREYIAILGEDKTRCIPYTLEEFEQRGRKEKLSENIFLFWVPLQ